MRRYSVSGADFGRVRPIADKTIMRKAKKVIQIFFI